MHLLIRTLKLGMTGKDIEAAKRAVARRLGGGKLERLVSKRPYETDAMARARRRTFGPFFVKDVKAAQLSFQIPQTGVVGPQLEDELYNAGCFDPYAIKLAEDYAAEHPKRTVPKLGPVTPGGKTVLNHDLTHATAGIDGYPAFDDAFSQGRDVIAPEALEVTGQSGANPGDAFYAVGASRLRYWFGHLDRAPSTGTRIRKGGVLARVAPNSVGGGPHVHVGIDAAPLIGHELEHRTDYRHGAETVGEQLRKWAKA